MRVYKLLILLFLITCSAIAVGNNNALQEIKTTNAPKVTGPYSQGMVVDLRKGKLLFVSGQSEDDPKTGKLYNESIAAATHQTLNNIEAVLKAAGTSWENVVRVDVYLNDLNDWAEMNKEYKKRFPNGIYPARVAVQALNGYRIEIACTAFVPDKQK